jgi:flavorubredoxin
MTDMAKRAGCAVQEPGLEIKYIPDEADLKRCFEFGKAMAQKIKA